jgi:hypothetical protein
LAGFASEKFLKLVVNRRFTPYLVSSRGGDAKTVEALLRNEIADSLGHLLERRFLAGESGRGRF